MKDFILNYIKEHYEVILYLDIKSKNDLQIIEMIISKDSWYNERYFTNNFYYMLNKIFTGLINGITHDITDWIYGERNKRYNKIYNYLYMNYMVTLTKYDWQILNKIDGTPLNIDIMYKELGDNEPDKGVLSLIVEAWKDDEVIKESEKLMKSGLLLK